MTNETTFKFTFKSTGPRVGAPDRNPAKNAFTNTDADCAICCEAVNHRSERYVTELAAPCDTVHTEVWHADCFEAQPLDGDLTILEAP